MMSDLGPSTVAVLSFGLGQTEVRERLGSLLDADHQPAVTTSSAKGIVTVHIGTGHDDTPVAEAQTEQTAKQVEQLLGPAVFGRGAQTIQESLVAILSSQGKTAVTAESCTGGLVGKMITDVSGSSGVYLGGWIVYSNQMKHQQLAVPTQLIQENGAVSPEVVRSLAINAIQHSGADCSMAVSGIAGPDGGTADKPVGVVWIGLGSKPSHLAGNITAETWLCQLSGDRHQVRHMAALYTLQLLRLNVLDASTISLSGATRVE